MSKKFEVEGRTFTTSTYTKQTDTDWCVGVDTPCTCHVGVADSKTRELALDFPNREFTAFAALLR